MNDEVGAAIILVLGFCGLLFGVFYLGTVCGTTTTRNEFCAEQGGRLLEGQGEHVCVGTKGALWKKER